MEASGKEKQKKSTKLWWNKEIEKLGEKKKKLYKKWFSTGQQVDRDRYSEIKRETRITIYAERDFYPIRNVRRRTRIWRSRISRGMEIH